MLSCSVSSENSQNSHTHNTQRKHSLRIRSESLFVSPIRISDWSPSPIPPRRNWIRFELLAVHNHRQSWTRSLQERVWGKQLNPSLLRLVGWIGSTPTHTLTRTTTLSHHAQCVGMFVPLLCWFCSWVGLCVWKNPKLSLHFYFIGIYCYFKLHGRDFLFFFQLKLVIYMLTIYFVAGFVVLSWSRFSLSVWIGCWYSRF